MARLLVIMGMWIIFIFAGLGYAEDQLTITTYYPSPYGNYRELSAQRMKIGTTYSDSGTTVADNDLIVEGNVGIGTKAPTVKLEVNGEIKATDGKLIYQCPADRSTDNECTSYCIGQLTLNSTCTYWYDTSSDPNYPWACAGSKILDCNPVGRLVAQ